MAYRNQWMLAPNTDDVPYKIAFRRIYNIARLITEMFQFLELHFHATLMSC